MEAYGARTLPNSQQVVIAGYKKRGRRGLEINGIKITILYYFSRAENYKIVNMKKIAWLEL
jgi:hypothetical protein